MGKNKKEIHEKDLFGEGKGIKNILSKQGGGGHFHFEKKILAHIGPYYNNKNMFYSSSHPTMSLQKLLM